MRSGGALIVAGCTALAVVAAAGALASQRQREAELSPLPSTENGGPRGLAAARAWLEATGRPHRVLRGGDAGPAPGEVVLLVTPPAAVGEAEAAALAAHAERGGLLVWAVGRTSQPALERRLGVGRATAPGDLGEHVATALAPHPIFDGIALRTSGSTLLALAPTALPVAGEGEHTSAASLPLGTGEAVLLAGPDVLENFRLGEGENLALLSRLASLGPIVFDERHLAGVDAGASPTGRAAGLLAAQVALAAVVLLLALGRRLGAVREQVLAGPARSARDYLESLASLYRLAGAERELAEESWLRLRRTLERRAGIPASTGVELAAERLALRRPEAAEALRRAAAGREAGSLFEVSRAAAALESSLSGRSRKQML